MLAGLGQDGALLPLLIFFDLLDGRRGEASIDERFGADAQERCLQVQGRPGHLGDSVNGPIGMFRSINGDQYFQHVVLQVGL